MKLPRHIAALALATAALSTYGADAAANWTAQCAKCHGPDGKGDTKMGHKLDIADLTDPKMQAKFTDDDAFKAMKPYGRYKFSVIIQRASDGKLGIIDPGIENEP